MLKRSLVSSPATLSRAAAITVGILGILMFSTKAVLVKLAYAEGIDTLPLMVLRMGFALPFYLVMALLQRPPQGTELRTKHWVGLVASGMLGYYLASLFDFMGLQYVMASLERLILFTYPIMVLLLSRALFKERLSRRQYGAMALTYLGVLIIFAPEIRELGEGVLWGGAMILLSAFCYALYLVGSGRLLPRFGTGPFTSYCMIVSCSCVLLHYGVTEQAGVLGYSPRVYGLGFAMAVVATVLPTYMISAAIRSLGAPTFSLFAALGPISTIVLAYLFLGESLTLLQWLGSGVIILSVWWARKH